MKTRQELENIKLLLIELIADFLDSKEVLLEESIGRFKDPLEREETELHIRMANAALREYENTVFSFKEITDKFLLDLGFKTYSLPFHYFLDIDSKNKQIVVRLNNDTKYIDFVMENVSESMLIEKELKSQKEVLDLIESLNN